MQLTHLTGKNMKAAENNGRSGEAVRTQRENAEIRYGRSQASIVGTFRRGEEMWEGRTDTTQEVSSLSFWCLAATSLSLLPFPSLALGPAKVGWWRSLRGRKKRRGGKKDERILKLWVGMEIRSFEKRKKERRKKRKDEKQMESVVDMTASSLASVDLLLVQLHGCICIYMIPQNAVMCWDLSLAICVHVCVCEHIHSRWSDRRCLSWCTLHKMRTHLVEEDHVHCVNRDNSDLISLQADSLWILIGKAPQDEAASCISSWLGTHGTVQGINKV